ncbi:MAG: glycosyltransferase WbuB [Candidatus Marinimicrobia bacterium]|nr:glycosyltransferase WbuB [Candidatus Neomarinimicrobiota bacterium]
MNILIISAVFPPEPVVSANLSRDLAEELSKNNQLTVLCPKPTRPNGFIMNNNFEPDNYKVVRLNSFTCPSSDLLGRFRESFSFGRYCQNYIEANHDKIDIIYANTWPFFAQYFTVSTSKKFNIPLIIHVHDIYPESFSNKIPALKTLLNFILLPIDKFLLNNATKIIAISKKMKNYLMNTRKISGDKIFIVQNWQDENNFMKFKLQGKLDIVDKPFTFMYLGNIGPVAGVNLLLESFFNANLKNCRLVIAGSGSMKEILKKKALELKLDTIEFWDVPDGKVPEIQNQADVMLLPIKKGSALSSIPSKLPAYMFSEKPIIGCMDKESDTAKAIIEANCGWILPPENPELLSRLMCEVSSLSNRELKNKGYKGFNYAINNYSKKRNLVKLVNLFK